MWPFSDSRITATATRVVLPPVQLVLWGRKLASARLAVRRFVLRRPGLPTHSELAARCLRFKRARSRRSHPLFKYVEMLFQHWIRFALLIVVLPAIAGGASQLVSMRKPGSARAWAVNPSY